MSIVLPYIVMLNMYLVKIPILGGIIISVGKTRYINKALWKLKYLIAILMKEIKYEINIFQHTTHLQQLEIMNE